MLPILCVRLTIKVKVGIPESFKVGWYPLKKTGSSHLKPFAEKCNFKKYGCQNSVAMLTSMSTYSSQRFLNVPR